MKTKPLDAALQGLERDARALYEHDVEALTTKLARGFRTGKYRGWEDGDAERFRGRHPPFFLLEDAVEEKVIRHDKRRAVLILFASPSIDEVSNLNECGPLPASGKKRTRASTAWETMHVLEIVCSAMALDIVHCAERRGYLPKPRRAA